MAKFLRSTYRREPVTSFVITMALMELVIGGFEQEWSLLGVAGFMTVGAIVFRYRSRRDLRSVTSDLSQRPEYYLPPAPPRPVLPRLTDKNS
ncbi:MAG: hypothetical protein HC916_18745 [Coleofasciculaceae cyanobacterium SM2_1_6]|nr:hypothetical protein [Coleofasciculaceae cyanobacterium SM2_1_6]